MPSENAPFLIFRFVLLWCLLLPAPAIYGKVEILDGSHGLSNNSVTTIGKDRRGLMWIGTRNGLNIYDGYTFVRPYPELSNEPITHLICDAHRPLVWVGTQNGLYVVEEDQGIVKYVGGDTVWPGSRVSALIPAPGSGVYAAFQNGVIALVDRQYRMTQLTRVSDTGDYARSMVLGPGNTLLYVPHNHAGKICRLHIPTGKADEIIPEGKRGFVRIERYGDTLLTLNLANGVRLYNVHTFRDITPEYLPAAATEMSVMYQGRILIALSGYHYVPDTLMEIDLRTGNRKNLGLNTGIYIGRQMYFCTFRDQEKILWIGTNRGIFKVTPEQQLFENILCQNDPPLSARQIVEDRNGDLYVGSWYGLFHYSRRRGSWTRYEHWDNARKVPARITALLDDGDYVYVAGLNTSLAPDFSRFNKRKRVFEHCYFPKQPRINLSGAFALHRDNEGIIWIGIRHGLVCYNPATNRLYDPGEKFFALRECIVQDIKPGLDKEILWISTDRGTYRVHKRFGVLFRFHKASLPALSANDVYYAEEDNQGRLWLGTNGGGVNIISADRRRVQYLNKEQHGLSNDIVYGILSQSDGKRWISTFNGLSCYDPVANTFLNYYKTDGLCDNEFNYKAHYIGSDGKMYLGGVNGINAFYPEQITSGATPKPLIFILPASRWDSRTKTFNAISNFRGNGELIELNSPNSSLVFNLGMTDYTDPVHNIFSYRIEGLTDDWISLSGDPILRLHGIPYGHYQVEIRAMNARGVPTANRLHFFLHVKRPFYNTWWFYLLMALLSSILVSVFFLIKYRSLKNMQKMRLHIASNLHDEVGSLLTSITLFSDNLRFGKNTGEEKDLRLGKIAALSREATVTMSDILWATDVRNDHLNSLSSRIREYAEELLLPLNIELIADIAETDTRLKIDAGLRQQLYLIFKEAVNNVVKHTDATCVTIRFRYIDAHAFAFCLSNNGIRNQHRNTQGQGLRNMEMRAKRIGAEMQQQESEGLFIISVRRGIT